MGSGTRILNRLFSFVFLLVATSAAFAAPASLRIRQAYVAYPALTVYVDILDSSGKPVAPGESEQFTTIVGGRPFDISKWKRFSAKEDGLLTVFLIDVSASIGQSRFNELRETLSAWIRRMGPLDRAAVMTLGETVSVAQVFTGEKNALLYAVQSLTAQDPGAQINLGILRALELAKMKGAGLPGRRMILLCSDGFREAPGGATADEVRLALSSDPVPIYSILFDSPERESANKNAEAQQLLNELGYDPGPVDGKLGPRTVSAIRVFQQSRGVAWNGAVSDELLGLLRTLSQKQKESALASIGEFSRRSGGQLYRAGTSPFAAIFDSVATSLNNALAVDFTLDGLLPDGALKRLEISFFDGAISLSDGISFRLTGEKIEILPNKTEDTAHGLPTWGYVLAAAAVALLPLSASLLKKRKFNFPQETTSSSAAKPSAHIHIAETGPTVILSGAPSTYSSIRVELSPSGTRVAGETLKATISDRLILGRSGGPSALAIRGDATISARHCELFFSKGRLFVRDLQSANGTMVNGVPIQGSYPLEDGDRLALGKTELRIRIPEME